MRRLALAGAALLLAVAAAAAGAPAPGPAATPVTFVTQAISWYRQQVAQAQLATEPADVVYAEATREQARQALSLAFEYARAAVALGGAAGGRAPAGKPGEPPQGSQAVRQRAAEAEGQVSSLQADVQALERRAAAAGPRARAGLERQLAETRSELQFATARRDALKSLADFSAGAGEGGGSGQLGQLQELQRSVPEIAAAGAPARPAAPMAVARRAAPSGILALASDLMSQSRKLRVLEDGAKLTGDLRAAADRQRAPLLAELRGLVQSAGQAGPAPDAPAAALEARTRALDEATARFRKLSAALVPLGKCGVLLDAQAASTSEWRGAADDQYDSELRKLALHLGLLAAAVAAILSASAVWRRATLRYVQDLRRRRQSLFLRRIVVSVAVALVLLFSFVTELGSVATFAGFITAGLAVALQNVILSVAAYFFLIGRYGIGVGDRVQISGITGDVIDIGLVRLHLMELGADGLPTGRVVVFSNSVLFQPSANFFKQPPGSSFAWHQVTVTLSAGTDFRQAEQRLLAAVGRVYQSSRAAIEREHDVMASQLSPLPVHPPGPQSHLRLTEGGLELTIRFPVPLDRAAAVDDEVTRALLDAIDAAPRLELAGSGKPTIQAAPEGAPAPA